MLAQCTTCFNNNPHTGEMLAMPKQPSEITYLFVMMYNTKTWYWCLGVKDCDQQHGDIAFTSKTWLCSDSTLYMTLRHLMNWLWCVLLWLHTISCIVTLFKFCCCTMTSSTLKNVECGCIVMHCIVTFIVFCCIMTSSTKCLVLSLHCEVFLCDTPS